MNIFMYLILCATLTFSQVINADDIQVNKVDGEPEVANTSDRIIINETVFEKTVNANGETSYVALVDNKPVGKVDSKGVVFYKKYADSLSEQGLFNIGMAIGWVRHNKGVLDNQTNVNSDSNIPFLEPSLSIRPSFYKHLNMGVNFPAGSNN